MTTETEAPQKIVVVAVTDGLLELIHEVAAMVHGSESHKIGWGSKLGRRAREDVDAARMVMEWADSAKENAVSVKNPKLYCQHGILYSVHCHICEGCFGDCDITYLEREARNKAYQAQEEREYQERVGGS